MDRVGRRHEKIMRRRGMIAKRLSSTLSRVEALAEPVVS